MRNASIVSLLVLLLAASCATQPRADIVVTFYPLLDITRQIAGPDARVETIIPPGVESHEYEPTASDMTRLAHAKVFVRMGLEWAPLEDRAMQSSSAAQIMASKDVPLLSVTEGETKAVDPHLWLSPRTMKLVARNIADGLKQADPSKADAYEANVRQVLARLTALDDEYTAGLASCKVRTLIVSHLAFAYPANEYGFKQLGISGLSPESEPSPQTLKELIDAALSQNIKHIVYEELVDPRVSETIAKEVGASAIVISHIDVQRPGEDYYSQMQDNLGTLRTALQCT